jgi:hypothetical protein
MHRHLQENSSCLEIENLFHSMAIPSGISNDDLRQWFLLPLPNNLMSTSKGLFDSTKKLQIELKKTNFATTIVYGEFARNKYDLMIPSISSQSGEKAFCGVESPTTFGDPRFDTRIKLLELDSDPQLTSTTRAIPNIRLLSTPEANAITSGESHVALPDQQIDSDQRATISIAPQFAGNMKLVLLRLHGQMKTLQGAPAPHIGLQAFSGKDGMIATYDSPWSPSKLSVAENWQQFNFMVPLPVSDLPGKVRALNILISDGDPQRQLLRKAHGQSTFAVKDFSMEISPLAFRPLEPGYVIY